MFGIHAYDSDPVRQGAQFAYEMGWTTPEKAIEGGAKWISEQYINNPNYKQNTLYKMRWNPQSPGTHQYATDISWAVSQTQAIKAMYDNFENAQLKFDIPSYS
jgi:type VI secretion system secreted protein VgrG